MRNYKIVFYDNDYPYPIGGHIQAHNIEEAKQIFNKEWRDCSLETIVEE